MIKQAAGTVDSRTLLVSEISDFPETLWTFLTSRATVARTQVNDNVVICTLWGQIHIIMAIGRDLKAAILTSGLQHYWLHS